MDAARPAARTTFAASEFVTRDDDATRPGLRFFWADDPAYEFVARQWRDIVPGSEHDGVRLEGVSKVVREWMDGSARYSACSHEVIIANSRQVWGPGRIMIVTYA